MQADLLIQVFLPVSLFLIMFGLGLSLRIADFTRVLATPRAVGVGLFGQLILLPLVALAIATLLRLSPEFAVGLMIIALVPGGVTSNMFTYLANGEVSLSISLTAVVSLITPFTIPLVVAWSMDHFMGGNTAFVMPVGKAIVQLMTITLIPVALGMLALSRWPSLAGKLERILKWFSILFLALIIVLIVLKNADNMGSFFAQAGLPTLLLNLSTVALGYRLAGWARLSKRQAICIGFEVGIQHGTLALLVAGTLIGNATMMIPAVTYSLTMFASAAAFGWWVNRGEPWEGAEESARS